MSQPGASQQWSSQSVTAVTSSTATSDNAAANALCSLMPGGCSSPPTVISRTSRRTRGRRLSGESYDFANPGVASNNFNFSNASDLCDCLAPANLPPDQDVVVVLLSRCAARPDTDGM